MSRLYTFAAEDSSVTGDIYKNGTIYTINKSTTSIRCGKTQTSPFPEYRAYFSYNTSSLSGKVILSAVVTLYVGTITQSGGITSLDVLLTCGWDDVSADMNLTSTDWFRGGAPWDGSIIGLTQNTSYSLPSALPPSNFVNLSGYTDFRIMSTTALTTGQSWLSNWTLKDTYLTVVTDEKVYYTFGG